MFEKWLEDETSNLKTIKITCNGDYKVGKSDFLRRYACDDSSTDNEDAGEVFVKILTEPPLKIGVELYELPSSANLDHQSCYTSIVCDAIVFFFETSNQKLGEHLASWLRHYFRDNLESLWQVPILLVGLKKDKLTPVEFAHERSKRLGEMRDVFRGSNLIFFGRDCEECDYQREMEHFHAFIRRVAYHKHFNTITSNRYLLRASRQTYWLLYSVRELCELGFREAVKWAWRKLNRTTSDKLQQNE